MATTWPYPVVFKDAFSFVLVPPSPGGVPREGPDCRFPSEAGVSGRTRGVILIYIFILFLSTAGLTIDLRGCLQVKSTPFFDPDPVGGVAGPSLAVNRPKPTKLKSEFPRGG